MDHEAARDDQRAADHASRRGTLSEERPGNHLAHDEEHGNVYAHETSEIDTPIHVHRETIGNEQSASDEQPQRAPVDETESDRRVAPNLEKSGENQKRQRCSHGLTIASGRRGRTLRTQVPIATDGHHIAMRQCFTMQRTKSSGPPHVGNTPAIRRHDSCEWDRQTARTGAAGQSTSRRRNVMKKVEAIIAPSELDAVRDSLIAHGVQGFSLSKVADYNGDPYRVGRYRGTSYTVDLHPKIKLEIVVCDEDALPTAYAIVDAARTGRPADETLTIVPVEDAMRVRTGEHGPDAIHDPVGPPAEIRWAANG